MNILRARATTLAFGFLLSSTVARADTYPRQPGVDITHYAFHVTLSDDSDVIEGETAITFRVVQDGVTTLALDLVQPKAAAQNRGMTVSAVTEAGKAVTFEHANDRLTLHLDPAGRAGETRTVVVRYRGIPITGLVIAPNKHGERTFFSENWPNRARQWLRPSTIPTTKPPRRCS